MLCSMTPETTTTDQPVRSALAWISPDQAELVGDVARHAGLRIDLVGCSGENCAASTPGVAGSLDAAPADDLRGAIASAPVEVIFIGALTPEESEHTLLARESLRALEQRNVRVFSLAPPPGRIGDLGHWFDAGPARIDMIPMVRRSPGFRAAVAAMEEFGPVRTVAISARSGVALGSLGARLVDAMDAALSLLGIPDSIDAAISHPSPATGVPETLLELRGDCGALLRHPDGKSASVSLTDQGGRWFRGVTILGEGGCLRVEDDGFEWIGHDGALIDRSERGPEAFDPARIIGSAIRRGLEGATEAEDPATLQRVLAMAEAAGLSARTGEPESPAKLLRLAGVHA